MTTIATSPKKFARLKLPMPMLDKLPARLKRLSRNVLLLASASLVCGCAHQSAMDTTSIKSGKSIRKIACAPWKPLKYHSKTDAPDTIYGIQVHNQTGANLNCASVNPQWVP